jgi:broad specificity phosphatase PhoE
MVAVARRKNSDSALLRTVLLFCTCLPSYSWPRLRTGISVCAPAPSAHLVCAYPLAFVRRVPGSGQPQRPSTSQAHLSGRRPHANRQAKALARLQRDMVSNDHFERRGGITRARAVSPEMAHEKAEDEAQQLAAHQSGQREVLGHRWLLMRHGQTNYNADGRVQGSSDMSRLSDEGRRQAQAVGRFLAHLQIDSVYVSPLTRAQETLEQAEEVAGKAFAESKVVIDDLREVDLHEWEGLYKKKIKETWPDIYNQWRGGNPAGFRLESGKYPIRDLWKRASGVWKQLLTEASGRDGAERLLGNKTSLLTGHNGVNQALFATAFGLSEEAFRQFEFPNCGVMELVWNPAEDRAREWRWIYPSRTEWKTMEETKLDLSNVPSASSEGGESESAESGGSSPVSD